jgi:hypothetical protein
MIYGAVIAGVALFLVGLNPLGLAAPVGPAVYIAVTVFFLVIVANIGLLSCVPANVYGYAATAAYALQTVPESQSAVTVLAANNPVVIVAVSAVLGAVFGLVSGKLADALGK